MSFSIEEKPANGEESGKTVYYLLRFDQDFKRLMYTEDIDAAKIEELYNNMFQWWWPWQNVADMGSRRFEVTKEGDSQIKIRFYLDSKEFGAAGFKFLYLHCRSNPENNCFLFATDRFRPVSHVQYLPLSRNCHLVLALLHRFHEET